MATYHRGEASIVYEVSGEGFPVLLIAPGGMRSAFTLWEKVPWNPMSALASSYQLIAMDQRNAGNSVAPISTEDSWSTYMLDQLGLMDYLGIERFHVIGMCIGGSYALGLVRAAGERIASAVLLQPIGLENNRHAFHQMFDDWASEIRTVHPETDKEVLKSFRSNMFDGEFVFNVSREELAACDTPILVFMGDDLYHPQSISREIAALGKNVEIVERWKDSELLSETDRRILTFLDSHN